MINTKTIQFLVKGFSIFLFIYFFSLSDLAAQGFEYSGSAHLAKSLAEYALKNDDPYTAIDYYEYYLNRKPNKHKIKFKLALLYLEIRDYNKSKHLLESIVKNQSNKYPLSYYYLSEIQKTHGQYELAKQNLIKFNKAYKNGKERRKYRKLSKLSVIGCELALKQKDSIINVEIIRLDTSINSKHIEQSPILINNNQLVYATSHIDELEYFHDFEEQYKPKRELVYATKENNNWEYQDIFACKDTLSDIVNFAISRDQKRAYFNKCKENYAGKNLCKLYVAKYISGKLSQIKALPNHVNIPNYSLSMPTVTFDSEKNKEIVYFSSNLPKSKGGKDIWYITYDKRRDKYSKPKNAGSKINTVGNEITPYIDQNTGALYFSSDALPGIGGFDIFKSYGAYRKWVAPVNIGSPVNSGYDDLYYTVNKNQRTGFFTSNRPGGNSLRSETCCDDIFEYIYNSKKTFRLQGHLFIQNKDDINLLLQSFVGQYNESEMLANTDIQIFIIDPVSKDTIFLSSHKANKDGSFDVALDKNNQYKILISNSDINPKSFIVDTKDRDPNINDLIDSGEIGIEALPSENIKINVFYEFNSSKITEESRNSLDTISDLMHKLPEISLLISAHTDGKGSEDYNLKLSQKRAENIRNYLIKKSIKKDRIKAKGYGESMPIAPNTLPDGSDNPSGRKQNRRTEIKFIKTEMLNE